MNDDESKKIEQPAPVSQKPLSQMTPEERALVNAPKPKTKASVDKDPKNLQHYLLVTHAPIINKIIKSLMATGQIPKKVGDRNVEESEFHEHGIRGLMEAVRDFNPEVSKRLGREYENPFAAFAQERIRGRIRDYADSMHPIPKYMRQHAKRFASLEAQNEPTQAQEEPTPTATPMPKIKPD